MDITTDVRARPTDAQGHRTADGRPLRNHGSKPITLGLLDDRGEAVPITKNFEVMNVTRPILSLGRLRRDRASVHMDDSIGEYLCYHGHSLPLRVRNSMYFVSAEFLMPDDAADMLLAPIEDGELETAEVPDLVPADIPLEEEGASEEAQVANSAVVPVAPSPEERAKHMLLHMPTDRGAQCS